MISLKQFLEEGRDSPLYHATNMERATRIIRNNELMAKTWHRPGYTPFKRGNTTPKDVISLTRSLKFANNWGARIGGNEYFIFELDQRKLTQRHKLVPYNHFGDTEYASPDAYGTRQLNDITRFNFPINQYEENVIGDIKNLDQYLIKIILSDRVYDNYFSEKSSDRQDALVEFGDKLTFHPKLWYRGKFINAHYHK